MIRSTFAGFTMAQMALSASQRAIDVVGQNVSNVNTIGYTRQRLDLMSINPVGSSGGSSPFDTKVGQGVMMTGVSQIRDPFLDIQYRNQIARVGTADSTDKILEQIGNVFDETTNPGIRDALNKVISQLDILAKPDTSGESSSEALVRSACEVLLNAMHQNASAMDDVTGDLIKKLKDTDISKLNTCIQQITELNESVKSSQILGNPALELQDQRNKLLDDLATYLPIKVNYRTDSSTGAKVDVLDVTFRDSAGNVHTLISDNKGADFQLGTTGGGVPVSLTIKDAVVETDPGNPTDPNNVNNINVADMLQDGVLKGSLDMLNKSEIFDGTDIKGIGFYGSMFNTFVNTFATAMNDLNAEKDADGNITVRHDLFTTSDGSADFTASNIQISPEWKDGTVTITKTTQGGPGGTDNTTEYGNVTNMINALTSGTHRFTFTAPDGTTALAYEGTMLDGYNNIQNTQAIERTASSTILKNHMSVLNQIASSKDSISGVNLDEETMGLMQYQQSYNAAARLMTTLDQLLDKLINSTGVVGR